MNPALGLPVSQAASGFWRISGNACQISKIPGKCGWFGLGESAKLPSHVIDQSAITSQDLI